MYQEDREIWKDFKSREEDITNLNNTTRDRVSRYIKNGWTSQTHLTQYTSIPEERIENFLGNEELYLKELTIITIYLFTLLESNLNTGVQT